MLEELHQGKRVSVDDLLTGRVWVNVDANQEACE